jgi:Leucine-rich repeat (LRR) protein
MKRKARMDLCAKKKAKCSTSDLAKFPSSIVGKILGSLSVQDACRARGACSSYGECKPQRRAAHLKFTTQEALARIQDTSVISCLRELTLDFNCDDDVHLVLSGFTGLQKLTFYQCDFKRFAEHVASLKNLKSVVLSSCLLTRNCFAVISTLSLECLDVVPSKFLSDQELGAIAQMTSLKQLRLRFCGNCTDAGIAHLTALKELEILDLRYAEKITDIGALSISRLTKLHTLNLQMVPISNAGLAHLAQLPGLTDLDLTMCTGINADGLQSLGERTTLKQLHLAWGAEVSPQGMAHLVKLVKLEVLNLTNCKKFNDAAAAFLRFFVNLEHLLLFETDITDASLLHIGTLVHLESLNLGATAITDAGLAHLAGLVHLEELNVHGTKVSEAGLVHLFGMKNLTKLEVSGVTQEGAAALARAIRNPKLRICLY